MSAQSDPIKRRTLNNQQRDEKQNFAIIFFLEEIQFFAKEGLIKTTLFECFSMEKNSSTSCSNLIQSSDLHKIKKVPIQLTFPLFSSFDLKF